MPDPNSSVVELEGYLRKNPEDYDKSIELATSYMVNGDYYSAANILQRVVMHVPPSEQYKEAYYQLGMVLKTLGAPASEALKCFEKVIEQDQDDGNALYHAGLVLIEMKETEKALDYLIKAMETIPLQQNLLYAIGNASIQLGNIEDCIKALEKAIEINPDDPKTRNMLATAYLMDNAYGEAEKLLQGTLKLIPDDTTATFLSALTDKKQEKEIEALERIEKYAKKDPENPFSLFALSAFHYLVGEYSPGKEVYEKGLRLLSGIKDTSLSGVLEIISSALVDIAEEKELMEEEEVNVKKDLVAAFQEIMAIKDPNIKEKSILIGSISEKMAKHSGEIDDDEIENIRIAGSLCNLGMAFLPDEIISKTETLTDNEKRILLSHPTICTKVLERIDIFSDLMPIIKHHHERYNGKGYPDRLKGDEIPIGAAIVGVADFFAELTIGSKRQKPAPKADVLKTINSLGDNFFSKDIIELLNKAAQ